MWILWSTSDKLQHKVFFLLWEGESVNAKKMEKPPKSDHGKLCFSSLRSRARTRLSLSFQSLLGAAITMRLQYFLSIFMQKHKCNASGVQEKKLLLPIRIEIGCFGEKITPLCYAHLVPCQRRPCPLGSAPLPPRGYGVDPIRGLLDLLCEERDELTNSHYPPANGVVGTWVPFGPKSRITRNVCTQLLCWSRTSGASYFNRG